MKGCQTRSVTVAGASITGRKQQKILDTFFEEQFKLVTKHLTEKIQKGADGLIRGDETAKATKEKTVA